jgi:hypothetical protein
VDAQKTVTIRWDLRRTGLSALTGHIQGGVAGG